MFEFKKCSCCDTPWASRDEFLGDCDIQLVGYQVNFNDLELGFLLFNHLTCESTIGVPAGFFRNLYDGPVFAECMRNSEFCSGYCLQRDALEHCNSKCAGAYVREILQIVGNWPKEICQPAKVAHG